MSSLRTAMGPDIDLWAQPTRSPAVAALSVSPPGPAGVISPASGPASPAPFAPAPVWKPATPGTQPTAEPSAADLTPDEVRALKALGMDLEQYAKAKAAKRLPTTTSADLTGEELKALQAVGIDPELYRKAKAAGLHRAGR